VSTRRSAAPARVRVASVPSDHVYVRHPQAPGGEPPPSPAAPWRPSPLIEPAGLRARAGDIDAVHLHFGFEHRTAAWVELLADLDIPLVLTVSCSTALCPPTDRQTERSLRRQNHPVRSTTPSQAHVR